MPKESSRGIHRVLHFFKEISKIPRRSYVTAPIAEYICSFAKERGLSFLRDAADNVIIKKPASADCVHMDAVILQAHTDMVFVTEDAKYEDRARCGLVLMEDGDFLSAEGTSLGGDDGIGMAYILAVLDDGALSHPPIEAVFTSNEEVGLLGATALDMGMLSGKMLINLDSDEEGILTAGCAGGSGAVIRLPFVRTASHPCYTLRIFDLPGGHSGVKIADGIPNAILLSVSVIEAISRHFPIRLSEIEGGEAANAIPAFASVRFSSDASVSEIEGLCKRLFSELNRSEWRGQCTLDMCEGDHPCLEEEESRRILQGLLSLPNGILAMEKKLPDLPETSLNLGIARVDDNALLLSYALRSSVNEKREALQEELAEAAKAIGADACFDGVYPAWEYREHSPLREACLLSHRELLGKEARVDVIHAGLECGIFAAGIEGLDAISFGPTNHAIHTAQERLSLSSAARTYDFLSDILKRLAK